ncbi:MAG: hypothetical protein KC505_09920 [Myxococcales bacterium]|nr:hypothetical protein [Myxococcales bacterium]USN50937.1 MAG: hypothetical protein H6731_00530 [Myxococcales bacterium]
MTYLSIRATALFSLLVSSSIFCNDNSYEFDMERAKFFVEYGNQEKQDAVTDDMRQQLHQKMDEMISFFATYIKAGKNYCKVKDELNALSIQIDDMKSLNNIKFETFFIVGTKLCMMTDLAQDRYCGVFNSTADFLLNEQRLEDSKLFLYADVRHVKIGSDSVNKYCIPIYSESGLFGIGTWLYTVAHGYDILSFSAKPGPAHRGRFQMSSMSLLGHDLVHNDGDRFFFFGEGKMHLVWKQYSENFEKVTQLFNSEVNPNAKIDKLLLFIWLHEYTDWISKDSAKKSWQNAENFCRWKKGQGSNNNEGDFVDEFYRLGLIPSDDLNQFA